MSVWHSIRCLLLLLLSLQATDLVSPGTALERATVSAPATASASTPASSSIPTPNPAFTLSLSRLSHPF